MTPSDPMPSATDRRYGKRKVVANLSLPDREITFIEMENGGLVEIDHGYLDGNTVPPTEPPGLDSAQRYAFLANNAAPPELASAQERLNADLATATTDGTFPPQERTTDGSADSPQNQKSSGDWVIVPSPASSRDWFRNTYCVQTDRFDRFYSYDTPLVWSKDRVNYFKAGLYSRWANTTRMHGVLDYQAGWFVATASGDLMPNEYIAIRVTSTRQGSAFAEASDTDNFDFGQPNDVYDLCINYHF
jgi:hypothetical protein